MALLGWKWRWVRLHTTHSWTVKTHKNSYKITDSYENVIKSVKIKIRLHSTFKALLRTNDFEFRFILQNNFVPEKIPMEMDDAKADHLTTPLQPKKYSIIAKDGRLLIHLTFKMSSPHCKNPLSSCWEWL